MNDEEKEENYNQEKIDKNSEIVKRAAQAAVSILSEIDSNFLTKTYHKGDDIWTMEERIILCISFEILFFGSEYKKTYY